MSKRTKIKWGQSSEDKANIIVHQFNETIKKQQKNNPKDITGIPVTINIKDFKNKAKSGTRKDFNREIDWMKKYIDNKNMREIVENPNGVKSTVWEYKKYESETNAINRKKARDKKEIENLPAKSRGEKTGQTRGEMADTRSEEYRPKKFNFQKSRSQKEWDMFKQSVDKQIMSNYTEDKINKAQAQYIKNLQDTFGDYSELIVNRVKQLSSEEFIKILKMDEQASFDFIHDPIDAQARLEYISKAWGIELPENFFDDFIDSEIYYMGSP